MAVSLGASHGYEILEKLGVANQLIHTSKAHLVTVAQTVTSLLFKDSEGQVIGSVGVTSKALSLLNHGIMGPASKDALCSQCESVLKKYLTNHPLMQSATTGIDFAKLADTTVVASMGAKSSLAKSLFKGSAILKGNKTLNVKADSEEANLSLVQVQAHMKELNSPIAKKGGGKSLFSDLAILSESCKVYEAVEGTSKGSVYYVAAVLQGVALAVRHKHNKLSIRVAGSELDKYKSALLSAGFAYKDGEYASVHYEVVEDDVGVKTIGAILAKLGLHKMQQVAELNKVVAL